MNGGVRVACPHCGTQLKLKSREAVGRKVACPRCQQPFVAAARENDDLFEPIELPPANPMAAIIRQKSKRERKEFVKKLRGQLRWIAAGGAALAIIVAAVMIPWSSLVPDVNLNPFADTPESILNDLALWTKDCTGTFERLHDGGSLQIGLAEVKKLDERLVDLYLRAVRVSPVSDQRLKAANDAHEAEADEFKERIAALSSKPNRTQPTQQAWSPENQKAAIDLRLASTAMFFELSRLQGVFNHMLRVPPTPESQSEKTQLEIINLWREAVARVSRVDSNAAAQAAVAALEPRKLQLQTLTKRLADESTSETSKLGGATFVYLRTMAAMRSEFGQVARAVTKRYELDSELEAATSRFSQFEVAESPAGDGARRAAAVDRFDAFHFTPPPQPVSEPTLADPGGPSAPPNTASGGIVPKFVDLYGTKKVLFIGLSEQLHIPAQQRQIIEGMRALVAKDPESIVIGKGTIFAYLTDVDVNQIASKITFGHVRSVDAAQRRIVLDIPRNGGLPPMVVPTTPSTAASQDPGPTTLHLVPSSPAPAAQTPNGSRPVPRPAMPASGSGL